MNRWQRWKQDHFPGTHWSATRDHAAVYRPTCSECQMHAVIWQRCACRVYFASCADHLNVTPAQRRAKHVCAVKKEAA